MLQTKEENVSFLHLIWLKLTYIYKHIYAHVGHTAPMFLYFRNVGNFFGNMKIVLLFEVKQKIRGLHRITGTQSRLTITDKFLSDVKEIFELNNIIWLSIWMFIDT